MKETHGKNDLDDLAATLALSAAAKALHDGADANQTRALIATLNMPTAAARKFIVALVDVQLAAHHAGRKLADDVHAMALQFYKDAPRLNNEEFWRRSDALASRMQTMSVVEENGR
jgi:hypothetical protein